VQQRGSNCLLKNASEQARLGGTAVLNLCVLAMQWPSCIVGAKLRCIAALCTCAGVGVCKDSAKGTWSQTCVHCVHVLLDCDVLGQMACIKFVCYVETRRFRNAGCGPHRVRKICAVLSPAPSSTAAFTAVIWTAVDSQNMLVCLLVVGQAQNRVVYVLTLGKCMCDVSMQQRHSVHLCV
jgi:hypothetical protein